MLIASPPTGADLELLLSKYAHRYPEKVRIPVIGDGGEELILPALIANPTGACKLTAGEQVNPAWEKVCGATVRGQGLPGNISELLVADCLIWPNVLEWGSWLTRWPGLASDVGDAILRKIGAYGVKLEEPYQGETPPDSVINILVSKPKATWRRAKMRNLQMVIVLEPPSASQWQMHQDALEKGEGVWGEIREFVKSRIVAFVDSDGAPLETSSIIERYPGVALPIGQQVNRLAGSVRQVELGEW